VSELGVGSACLFFTLFAAFVAVIIALDFWLHKEFGENYTITFGVRYLVQHVPLLTHTLMFLFGMMVGGLMVHFFGAPGLWWE
jgi:hypothetical protein